LAQGVRRELPVWRKGIRLWRRTRPFWGGLLLILGGLEFLWSTNMNPFGWQFSAPGFEGFMSYLLPGILIASGALSWVSPRQRMFYSIIAAVTALYALMGLNLGGFFIGTVLGLIGAALTFAWTPVRRAQTEPTESDVDSDVGEAVGQRSPRHLAAIIALVATSVGVGLLVAPPAPAEAAPAIQAAPAASGVAINPGKLTATRLDLQGFAFRGVVTVATPKGNIRALKFTIATSTLANFSLVTTNASGRRQQTKSNPLIASGNVQFYTSRFSGRLLGVPLTFTPLLPPPITLPQMTFTAVSIDLVLLICDRLTAPTLNQAWLN
jgi:hypothetical protein